jgi:hypothetical protein
VRLGKVLAVDYLPAAHPDPDQPPNHAGPDGFDPAVAADAREPEVVDELRSSG